MFLTKFLSHQVIRLCNWRPRTGIKYNSNSVLARFEQHNSKTLAACSEQAGTVEG
jgi:hypothetical protein